MAVQKLVVCGSPHSGKTTVSVKLAKLIEKRTKASVMVVFASDKGSPMTYSFLKKESLGGSLGRLITKPDITEQDIIDTMLLPKSESNVCFLGYRIGESFGMFPEISTSQVQNFYKVLSKIVDYIIVDTGNNFENNLISKLALEQFDQVVYCCAADIMGLSYYKSAAPILKGIIDREPDAFLLNDVKAFTGVSVVQDQLGCVDYVLPYDVTLLEQSLEGRMIDGVKINKRKRNFCYILSLLLDDILVE